MNMTNQLRFSLGFAAMALLAACDKTAPAENAANAAAETPAAANTAEAAPANVAAAPVAAGGAVTADYMVGKWSAMGEDCASTLEFRKDGTVKTPFGDAKWTLAGDQLGVDFGDGSKQEPSTIKVLGPDRIEISKKSGGKETQKRC
jgi:methionine-rich copper-binding protein CopC